MVLEREGISVASLSSLPVPCAAPAAGVPSKPPTREPDAHPLGTMVQARFTAVHPQTAAHLVLLAAGPWRPCVPPAVDWRECALQAKTAAFRASARALPPGCGPASGFPPVFLHVRSYRPGAGAEQSPPPSRPVGMAGHVLTPSRHLPHAHASRPLRGTSA